MPARSPCSTRRRKPRSRGGFAGCMPCAVTRTASIACKLCEAVCPAVCITIEADTAPDGTRRTTRYDIDLFKCVYCGFCEEACPTDAIVLTQIFEFHFENRGEEVLHKDELLAIGDRCAQQIAADRRTDAAFR